MSRTEAVHRNFGLKDASILRFNDCALDRGRRTTTLIPTGCDNANIILLIHYGLKEAIPENSKLRYSMAASPSPLTTTHLRDARIESTSTDCTSMWLTVIPSRPPGDILRADRLRGWSKGVLHLWLRKIIIWLLKLTLNGVDVIGLIDVSVIYGVHHRLIIPKEPGLLEAVVVYGILRGH
jgi:hypothetical protein